MRLQIYSDLHMEFRSQLEFADLIDPCHLGTTMILAGDIDMLTHQLKECLIQASYLAEHVLFVPGNHEYYGSEFHAAHLEMDQWNIPNVEILINRAVEIEGKKFFGGTCWPKISPGMEGYISRIINDFRSIKGMTVELMREMHDDFEIALREEPDVDVVISHFLPHPASVHPNFFGEASNEYFVANVGHLVTKPEVWIHGHTHFSFDYDLVGTRVVCNPLGYPGENYIYSPRECIVEI